MLVFILSVVRSEIRPALGTRGSARQSNLWSHYVRPNGPRSVNGLLYRSNCFSPQNVLLSWFPIKFPISLSSILASDVVMITLLFTIVVNKPNMFPKLNLSSLLRLLQHYVVAPAIFETSMCVRSTFEQVRLISALYNNCRCQIHLNVNGQA